MAGDAHPSERPREWHPEGLTYSRAERQMEAAQVFGKEGSMNSTTRKSLELMEEELAILGELLESERARLLIEIRHTHHRSFRDDLRRRLELVESVAGRCRPAAAAG